jgi:pimeloyl-ACP methyl ester carboxylesterase
MHARVSRSAAPVDPPIVFVHGLGVSSRYFVPLARRLALDRSVFAPDLPGFGRSERPGHALPVDQHADALSAWMDAAGLENAVLVANSLGCQIAADAAMRFPARVERLVLVAPTVDPQARSASRQVLRLIRDIPHESPSLAVIVAWDYLTAGPRRLWRTLRAALADRIEEKLPAIQQPTLVVRGENDPIVPQRWAEEVTQLLPRGRLEVVARSGHAAHYTAADDLASLVRRFLAEEK